MYVVSYLTQKSFFPQSLPAIFCKLNETSLSFHKSKNGSEQMMHLVQPPPIIAISLQNCLILRIMIL